MPYRCDKELQWEANPAKVYTCVQLPDATSSREVDEILPRDSDSAGGCFLGGSWGLRQFQAVGKGGVKMPPREFVGSGSGGQDLSPFLQKSLTGQKCFSCGSRVSAGGVWGVCVWRK